MYNEKNATSIVAYILLHNNAKCITITKLMQLMYLIEKESIRLYDKLIIWDQFCLLSNSPVLKNTYKLITSEQLSHKWDIFIDRVNPELIKLKHT